MYARLNPDKYNSLLRHAPTPRTSVSTANLPPLSDELAVRQLLGLSLADVHTVEGKEPFTSLLLLLFCQPCDVAGDDPCHADARQ